MIANVCLQAVFWEIQACVSSTVLFYDIMVASTKLTIGIFFYQGHTCLQETHIKDAFFLLHWGRSLSDLIKDKGSFSNIFETLPGLSRLSKERALLVHK